MADQEALKTLLETDDYDAAVRSGNNTEVLQLLHEEETDEAIVSKRWRAVSTEDFLDIVAQIQNLTAAQEERIRTYTSGRDTVPVHRPGFRTWIQANFPPAAVNALKAKSQVLGRPVDSLLGDDEERVSLQDVRKVVAQISKSHIVQQASPAAEAARQARRIIKRRASAQIQQLREKMMPAREQEFVDFRNAIFATQGADQADTDQLRVAMIDAKLTEEGL